MPRTPRCAGATRLGDQLIDIEELWGSNRSDLLRGNHTANRLFGNGGNDQLYGAGGSDFLRGGMGDDNIYGDAGKDMLFGDMGVDEIFGGSGDDTIFGGARPTTSSRAAPGRMFWRAETARTVLDGDGRMDADGNDVDDGMMDTAAYTRSPEAVTVNLRGAGTAEDPIAMGGHATGDMFMRIENLRGSMHDDMLIGDDMANMIYGNMGADQIKGMGGADTLYGGKGADTLYGGMGDDTLMGEMGDDALKGEEGDDTLIGGPGADKLFGGTVNMVDGEPMPESDPDGMDTADYSMSPAGVMVDLTPDDVDDDRRTPDAIPMGKGGDAEGDEYHDIQNLTGSAHTDMLKGDMYDNVLMGMDGDDWDDPETTDVMEGGLFGGGGQDELHGGDGNDWLDASGRGETAGAVTDTDGDAEANTANLVMGGKGNDMLIGGAGHDRNETRSGRAGRFKRRDRRRHGRRQRDHVRGRPLRRRRRRHAGRWRRRRHAHGRQPATT